MIMMVDGLERLPPLHFGDSSSSIFLQEACTPQCVAAGARVRAALTQHKPETGRQIYEMFSKRQMK
jgi:hypothetical protein